MSSHATDLGLYKILSSLLMHPELAALCNVTVTFLIIGHLEYRVGSDCQTESRQHCVIFRQYIAMIIGFVCMLPFTRLSQRHCIISIFFSEMAENFSSFLLWNTTTSRALAVI